VSKKPETCGVAGTCIGEPLLGVWIAAGPESHDAHASTANRSALLERPPHREGDESIDAGDDERTRSPFRAS
jgi:hypothetical protein